MSRSPEADHPFVVIRKSRSRTALAARAAAAALALWLSAASTPARADTVVLRNGNRIQGEVVAEGPEGVTVRFDGGTLTLKPREVASIERESRLQYLLGEGEAHLRRGDAEGAVEAYVRARKEDPASEEALRGALLARERLSRRLESEGRFEAAIGAWRTLLGEAPDHPRAAGEIARLEATVREEAADEAAAARALSSGGVESALGRLRALHERFPERRAAIGPLLARALVRSGESRLAAGKADEAEPRFLEAAGLDPDQIPRLAPGFARARAQRLAPLVGEGRFQEVLDEASEGLRIAPGDPGLTYLSALALDGLGRGQEAADGYRRVIGVREGDGPRSIDALRRAAEEKLSGQGGAAAAGERRREEVLPGDFREIQTSHFVIRHRNDEVGAEVAEAAEAAYGRIREDLALGLDWRKRCTVVIYPTREEFQEATGQKDWTGGAHRILRKMGVLTDHRITPTRHSPAWRAR